MKYFEIKYIVAADDNVNIGQVKGIAQDFLASSPDLNVEDNAVIEIYAAQADAGYGDNSAFKV